jgi:Family of unknown function (DUF6868)
MTIEILTRFLAWCLVINYGILILWFLVFVLARDWIYGLHRKWYPISPEQFNAINYAGIAFYKILVFVFVLVPYIALRIIG